MQQLHLPTELDEKFQALANNAGISKKDYIIDILTTYAKSKNYRNSLYLSKINESIEEVKQGKVINKTLDELEAMTNE